MRKVDSTACRYTVEGKPVHNHAGCYAEHHAHSLSGQQKQWLGRTMLHATPQPGPRLQSLSGSTQISV